MSDKDKNWLYSLAALILLAIFGKDNISQYITNNMIASEENKTDDKMDGDVNAAD